MNRNREVAGNHQPDEAYLPTAAQRAACHDPYDAWTPPVIGRMKVAATKGSRVGYLASGVVALADLAAPNLLRKLFRVRPARYVHTDALLLMSGGSYIRTDDFLAHAESAAISVNGGIGWGYPFDWYTRNAPNEVYPANSVPFITVTPYVMEALLSIATDDPARADRALGLFLDTWGFLESLRTMAESPEHLALSYGPVDEQLKIINANAYAAYAYALHALHGEPAYRAVARDKSVRIARWVVAQQESNGAWWYLADARFNNFMDCFHSCFTVKNLAKARNLLGADLGFADQAISAGREFIRNNFYDPASGLCRRFLAKGTKDPLFNWDIYDQAEYLGLLIDDGRLDEAQNFRATVRSRFARGPDWYCRIDIFGRPWGRNFLRWGIMPFLYQCSRLERALGEPKHGGNLRHPPALTGKAIAAP